MLTILPHWTTASVPPLQLTANLAAVGTPLFWWTTLKRISSTLLKAGRVATLRGVVRVHASGLGLSCAVPVLVIIL